MRNKIIRNVLIVLAISVSIYSLFWYFLIGLYTFQGVRGRMLFTALEEARPHAPYLSDLLRLFPDAEVTYKYFGAGDGPGFDVNVELYTRYAFRMTLPVYFDTSRQRVIGYGEPGFQLLEIEVQEGLGRSFKGERRFGAVEWQRIVESNGDFAAIGYSMIKDQPVSGFKTLLRRTEAEE